MAINLENRVGEITLALSEKGIRANVLVKEEGLIGKKKQQLYITVNVISEAESKRNCAIINETMLNNFGYGTSSTRYEDNTLEFKYTPLREDDSKKNSTYRAPGCDKQ